MNMMEKKYKKMYLVSREVLAYNIKGAMSGKGTIYSITMAEEKFQPEFKANNKVGFTAKRDEKTKRRKG